VGKKKKSAVIRGKTVIHSKPENKKAGKSGMKKPVRIIILVAIILVAAILSYVGYRLASSGKATPILSVDNLTITPRSGWWPRPPEMTIDQNKEYFATIETSFGNIELQLFPKEAPIAVNSFVFLARQNFYDGLKFHRILKDFAIQGGDPIGSGSGNAGYRFADEPVVRDYVPGTLAMANDGPNRNGSQFFITLADLSNTADPNKAVTKTYTIFGMVINGMDVALKIGDVPTQPLSTLGGEASRPVTPVIIQHISIQEK
jgi:cyclophilin family peptidyl-prolyl cis-trans isomerase